MQANERREQIKELISESKEPITATRLAEIMGVSRQIIVGDIALLRAQGKDIIATSRGYIIPQETLGSRYIGKVACQHKVKDMIQELYAIVDLGAEVVNVMIEHQLYGELTGQMNLRTRAEVDAFINKAMISRDKLLSELTKGVHLHTVACRNADHFEWVRTALRRLGYLYEGR